MGPAQLPSTPKILLEVIVLGYARGLISSRQIERVCQENVIFIALSYGYAPDHSTLASFVSSMQSEIQTLFSNILLVCAGLGLLDGTNFSLDGVKLSVNVSKEWSGTLEELKHKRDKLQEKLQWVIAEHSQADRQPEQVVARQKKRERRFEQQVARLNEFLKDREPKRGSDGQEIQSNAVDNESVKMPTSHGVVQGYNAQALVDAKHQVILAEDCAACAWRARYLSRAGASGRYLTIPVQGQPRNLIDEMKAKLDSDEGKRIYARRLAIVEPVFANLCVHKRMHRCVQARVVSRLAEAADNSCLHTHRFTLRSKRKVDVQWHLYALVHTIGKIHTSGLLN
jgi:hypothetical protein